MQGLRERLGDSARSFGEVFRNPDLRRLQLAWAGSLIGNPALPTPMAQAQARAEPKGVFKVTRHPMMWGFALWALSHIVLWWSVRTLIVAGIIVGVTEATQLVGTEAIDFDIESFDNAVFGEGFGQGLAEAMDCKGEYATSVGLLTSESHMLWLEAANAWIAENCPEMTLVTPTPYENKNDDQYSRQLADEILGTYPIDVH